MSNKEFPEGFKQAEIGLIPEVWEVVRLGDVVEVKSGGNAPQGDHYFKNGKYPFVRVQHFDGSHNYVDKWDLINDLAIKDYRLKSFPRGTIIFPKSGAAIRLEKRATLPVDCYVVSHLAVLLPDSSFINNEFLLYFIKTVKFTPESGGTTLPYLNLSRISETEIPLPPLGEQQQIAKVLSVIQEAIEHQDKIIDATRKLKKSLMHKLFTEGLNGEEQKETEIGRVPKSWDAVKLGDVCKKPQYGFTASATQRDTGLKFLRISDIQDQKVYWNDVPCCECSEEELKKYKLEKGDIVIARIGATTGKSYFLDESTPLSVFGSYLIRIKTKEELNPDYLYQFFNSRGYWEQINKSKGGRLKGGVNSSVLVNMKIPLPPLPGQQQIAHILSIVDKKIEVEERRKATLKELFKTMLHKLMSGEIRLNKVEI